jgi:heat shock protein HslJ
MHNGRCHSSVVVLIALAAAACSSDPGTESQASQEAEEAAPPAVSSSASADLEPAAFEALPGDLIGSWTLVAIDGEPIAEVGKTPTMKILEDGTVSGVGGINRYSTQLKVTDGRPVFGPTASTKMAGPPEAMALESAFFTRLGAVSNYQIDGGTLRLWAGDGEALTFERTED